MAFIYSKNSGHCLILASQEALIYPLNLGNFQEIRWGGFFSVVSGGSGNFNTPFSAFTGGITAPVVTFYMGLKDSGSALPGPGSNFVGVTKKSTDTQISITPTNLNFSVTNGAGPGNFTTIDSTGNILYFTAQTQNQIPITVATGDTNFASFWGITFGLVGNAFSGMAIYDTNFYTDVSTGNLSRLVNAPPSVSNFITGFYTTGGVNSSNNLQIPQAIYIYFPFPNNAFRIHALDVEKFN